MRIAWLAILVAACNGEPSGPDSGGSGNGRRKVVGHVEVMVYRNVQDEPPVVGAEVAFVDPDGEGRIVLTGADGVARGEVVPGGSVTALVPLIPDQWPYLSTVLDVRDGDQLSLGWARDVEPPPPVEGAPSCTDATLTARYTHVPSDVTHLGIERIAGTNTVFANVPLAETTEVTVTGAGATRAYVYTNVQGPQPPQAMPPQQWIAEGIDGCATSYELDLRHNLLPWIGVPTLDTDLDVINIPIDGQGGGDLMHTSISYLRGEGQGVNWEIAGPHAGTVILPSLPDELAVLMPAATDALSSANIILIDDDAIHGYDHARMRATTLAKARFQRKLETRERVRMSGRFMFF